MRQKKLLSNPYLVGLSLGVLTIALSAAIRNSEKNRFHALQQVRADYGARDVAEDLEERVRGMERMAKRIALLGANEFHQWEVDADSFRSDFQDIESLTYYRNGKKPISWTSPLSAAPLAGEIPAQTRVSAFQNNGPKLLISVPVASDGVPQGVLHGLVDASKLFGTLNDLRLSQTEVLGTGGKVFSNFVESSKPITEEWLKVVTVELPWIRLHVRTYPTIEAVRIGQSSASRVVLFTGLLISLLFAWIGKLVARLAEKRKVLEASKKHLEDILELAPVGFLYADANGKSVQVNRAWKEITGLSAEESRGDSWRNCVAPREREQIEASWISATKGEGDFSCEFQIRRKDGEMAWLKSKAAKICDIATGECSLIVAFLDVTRLRKTKAALREKEEFLSAIVDNLPLGLFCKDAASDFRFTLLNRKSEEIAGINRDFLLGKTGHEFFPKEQADYFLEKDLLAMNHSGPLKIEEEPVTRKDGTSVWVRTLKVPVKDSSGRPRYLLGISEDITMQRQMQKQLEEQKLRLAYIDKMSALGEMAAGIGHEINNPLTIIGGNAAHLKKLASSEDPDREKILKAATTIQSTVERAAKIIQGLETFSRDGGNEPLEEVRLEEVAEEALGFCRGRFGKRGVKVTLRGFEDQAPVTARRVQLSQVLLNLLNNSFYAVKDQKESFVSIETEDLGDQIALSVTDSGSKIPDEVAEKLMQPFYTTKEVGEGTGLGLSISNNIVEGHGGRLYLDREHPHTRFVMLLPKRASTPASPQIGGRA